MNVSANIEQGEALPPHPSHRTVRTDLVYGSCILNITIWQHNTSSMSFVLYALWGQFDFIIVVTFIAGFGVLAQRQSTKLDSNFLPHTTCLFRHHYSQYTESTCPVDQTACVSMTNFNYSSKSQSMLPPFAAHHTFGNGSLLYTHWQRSAWFYPPHHY